jgi:hypothetical protein
MQDPATIAAALSQHTGSETFYRHWTRRAVYTMGVQDMAERCEAHWLIDAILSHQRSPKVRAEEFQVWTLTRNKTGSGATLTCTDGGKGAEPVVVARQRIPFTDFPLPHIELWFANGTLYLPNEH